MQGVRILIASGPREAPVEPGPWAAGHHVDLAHRAHDVLERVRREPFELVVLDLEVPPDEAVGLMDAVRRARPGALVVIRPRETTVDVALTAFRRGAWDVVPEPIDRDALRALADRAVLVREAGERRRRMSEELATERLRVDELRRRLARAGAREDASAPGTDGPTLRELERRRILEVLRETGGNKKRAASKLGIHRSTLYAKLERYGIEASSGARDRGPAGPVTPEATGTDG